MFAKAMAKYLKKYPCYNKFSLLRIDSLDSFDMDNLCNTPVSVPIAIGSSSSPICRRVVFFPEALRDPETWLIVVSVGAGLLIILDVGSVSFGFSVIVPVGADVCVEDV